MTAAIRGIPLKLIFSIAALLWLTSCATSGTNSGPTDPDWLRHQESVLALSDWELSGRLNVRQQNTSDTVSINWQQQDQNFEIRFSGTLGLGAVQVHGSPDEVVVEKASADPVVLPDLQALTQNYLGYDFPAAQLLYWVRGVPAPAGIINTTLDENLMLGTLIQADTTGRQWALEYDRYQQVQDVWLPGRIRVKSENIQLTFLINEWLTAPTP
ncbi:MAG: lipoprotein insertase outer membrane protein LolB [Pseudomonadota bacterium]